MSLPDPPRRETAIDAVRSIWVDRRDAELRLTRAQGVTRLPFRGGELYLPPGHAAAPRLRGLLAQSAAPGSRHASRIEEVMRTLVERLVGLLLAPDVREWTIEGVEAAGDLVGPLPTAALIMSGTVRDLGEAELLERLGGERSLVVAHGDSELLTSLPGADRKTDAFLLSRAEVPVTVEALLSQAPGERLEVLRALCRLESIQLLQRVAEHAREPEEAPDSESWTRSLVERFAERIRRSLENRPLTLDPETHYRLVAERIGRLAATNHYELLELEVHSDQRAVHRAYDRIARLSHPIHAARLGLSAESLAMVFEHATIAYVTLGDAERRARYNFEAGVDRGGELGEEERAERRVAAAQQAYDRARRLAAKEEIHFAIELARQAVSTDPQPRYLALLGRLLARNPQWFADSIAAYQRAIELAPADADLRFELAARYEEHGDLQRARSICREILEHQPSYARAQGLLAQLDAALRAPQRGPGLLDRILGWFRGPGSKPAD
ncbi:MAG TPA: tetratricopeptide repeat protein [Thermoanaerobaculia bacterium]|nr:tetratricopeptide repeat protein [Thermoanaerobaculia bacterium]